MLRPPPRRVFLFVPQEIEIVSSENGASDDVTTNGGVDEDFGDDSDFEESASIGQHRKRPTTAKHIAQASPPKKRRNSSGASRKPKLSSTATNTSTDAEVQPDSASVRSSNTPTTTIFTLDEKASTEAVDEDGNQEGRRTDDNDKGGESPSSSLYRSPSAAASPEVLLSPGMQHTTNSSSSPEVVITADCFSLQENLHRRRNFQAGVRAASGDREDDPAVQASTANGGGEGGPSQGGTGRVSGGVEATGAPTDAKMKPAAAAAANAPRGKGKGKAGASGGVKLTPMEQQVSELKAQHPGVLLLVECGYRYRFFGDDALAAAKVKS